MFENIHLYDSDALIDRLTNGIKRRSQEVVFLVGSPISAAPRPGDLGVPDVGGMIDLIRREFSDDPIHLAALDRAIEDSPANRYQIAMLFVQGRRGQQTINEIVRRAVIAARLPTAVQPLATREPTDSPDEVWRNLEFDVTGWSLTPSTESLGRLIAAYPARFGRSILTTNFDPLIEVGIRRAGGAYFRTTLQSDGNLSQSEGTGCHVIHLHGYWYGCDTLHTPRQLAHPRPRLRQSLTSLIRQKLVVVCAYGGWDDIFTDALVEVANDDTAYPEIAWALYSKTPTVPETLSRRLTSGIDRGRINFYRDIDCHTFFPQLYEFWSQHEPRPLESVRPKSNPVLVPNISGELLDSGREPSVIEGDDEDRPPIVEICVGRERELVALQESQARVVFLTGLGGQGKSTVAARYFGECQTRSHNFSVYAWRDCKEEGERFENQLSAVIERLSHGLHLFRPLFFAEQINFRWTK